MGHRIAVLVGSLRKESLNKKLAQAMISLQPPSLQLDIINLEKLEMYNEDLETQTPAAWTEFRDKMKEYEGVIFVPPEYNRSVPAVLKNAIDIGSRPFGQSVWSKKPAAVITLSPGAYGGFGANHHIRQSLVFLNMPVLQQPEAYLGGAATLFAENGELTAERTKGLLTKFLIAFEKLVKLHSSKSK